MAKQYDATTKELFESDPAAWARLAGIDADKVEIINPELSTVSADADKVLRVVARSEYLAEFEFQSSYSPEVPARALKYSVLLTERHGLPVKSIVFLLRPEADGPSMHSPFRRSVEGAKNYLEFHFEAIKLWQIKPRQLLNSSIWLLPLLPISSASKKELPSLVAAIKERAASELSAKNKSKLWSCTYFLAGLCYPDAFVQKLLKGVQDMEESTTYQAVLAKGEARGEARGQSSEAKRILLRLGTKRLGEPGRNIAALLKREHSVSRIEQLIDRLDHAKSWDDLLNA